MTLGKDMIVERLRNALKASVAEARKDPEFLGKVVSTVCVEFGLDPMASMYIAGKLKNVVKEKVSSGEAE
jgi:hypothetical protein